MTAGEQESPSSPRLALSKAAVMEPGQEHKETMACLKIKKKSLVICKTSPRPLGSHFQSVLKFRVSYQVLFQRSGEAGCPVAAPHSVQR